MTMPLPPAGPSAPVRPALASANASSDAPAPAAPAAVRTLAYGPLDPASGAALGAASGVLDRAQRRAELTRVAAPLAPAVWTGAEPRAADLTAAFFARYAGTTLRTYESKLAAYAGWLGVPLPELPGVVLERGGTQTHLSVQAWKAYLRDERRLAPSTINGHLAAIHAVVAFLREAGLCDWRLQLRYEKARGYRDTRGPGLKALRRVLGAAAAAETPARAARDVAILRLLTDLGLRRGELVALDLAHVEFGEDGRPAAVSVQGKGHVDRERLTLPPKTAAALAAWLGHHPTASRGPSAGPARGVPLFTALDPGAGRIGRGGRAREVGARLTGLGVAKLLAALARRAGIKAAVRPHGVRHTAITALLDAGLPIRDVQRFSRHADVRTLAVYDDNRQNIAGRVAVTMSELV